jgi:D-alanine-D-alanine ligase
VKSHILSVGVVMGGISAEHDVSVKSGCGMLKNLDTKKFAGFPIFISRENIWFWPKDNEKMTPYPHSADEFADIISNPGKKWNKAKFPNFSEFPKCDIMLLGLHGEGGEDGRLQGFFDLCGQVYSGSGCLSSGTAMDKIRSKEIYRNHNILTPDFAILETKSDISGVDLEKRFGLPLVLKQPMGGSSLGMAIPQNRAELKQSLEDLSSGTDVILVEEYIKGREATCGYIENFQKLPPTEIIPMKDDFFNYEAKYDTERTREVTPGDFSSELTSKMQELAEKCHKALGLSVYSRTDFLLKEDKLYVLETNNLPGFTNASILPQQAAAAGLSYSELLTKIIEESVLVNS